MNVPNLEILYEKKSFEAVEAVALMEAVDREPNDPDLPNLYALIVCCNYGPKGNHRKAKVWFEIAMNRLHVDRFRACMATYANKHAVIFEAVLKEHGDDIGMQRALVA